MIKTKSMIFTAAIAFLIMLLPAVLLCSVANAEKEDDHLQPCFYTMMGAGPVSEYYITLNKMFFSERPLARVAMMTIPSFDTESAVMIYLHGKEEATVEYVRPVKQIWWTLINNDQSKVDHSIRFMPLENIKIESYTRNISRKTAETLEETWGHMIARARIDSLGDMMIIDGTRYYFSVAGMLCGSHYSTKVGPTVDELMGLADELEQYAKSEKGSKITEESILSRAQALLKKLGKK